MWKLVIEDDEGKRTVVPLSRDDYTIGRQEGNTIRLTERNVSRAHGRVRKSRGQAGNAVFVLEDLRSYNGLFVNGLRVAHTQDLQHGDLIQIGDYRIVLQDDAAAAIESAAIPVTHADPQDAKATIPISAGYRGQTLTERPNRFVMLVGPTPGVEYPLDRERMTVGRAEESNISVNHNSVSRLHCEIHAIGDGRFEIVDKGSSNGVRVNAVELRRSIIEAGDVIELGDVRFKFVGVGQIFVPGPNESQQLTAISDRDAELATGKKGFGAYAIPVLGAGILGAAIIVALAWVLKYRNMQGTEDAGGLADADQSAVLAARAACTVDDCESGHNAISSLAESSPWKESPEARAVMQTWAESLLRKARADQDVVTRRATLSRVIADGHVDMAQRKVASDLFDQTNTAQVQPDPSGYGDAGSSTSSTTAPPAGRPSATPTSHLQITNATATTTPTNPQPKPTTTTRDTNPNATFERASEAGLRGDFQVVRNLLEKKVREGRASAAEANLVRQACKAQGDKACADDIKAKYPSP